jgi:hypothetical protein
MVAGGTPKVDDPRYWTDDDDGVAWAAIGDMTRGPVLQTTSRRVTAQGIAAARLTVGRPGTLLFAMYASLGAMATLKVPAAWNQAIVGITARPGSSVTFLRYSLEDLRRSLSSLARSNTQDNLNQEQVANLPLLVPSLPHQVAVADFLDRECARIDRAVALGASSKDALERSLSGLVANAIAGLPRHRLKQTWRVIDCKHRTPTYLDDLGAGHPVISTREVRPGRLVIDGATRRVADADFRDLRAGQRDPVAGDLIYSRNARLGVAALVGEGQSVCMGQDVVLITRRPATSYLLAYVLNYAVAEQVALAAIGSTFDRINVPVIRDLRVPCGTPEQEAQIVELLDHRFDAVERAACANKSLVDALAVYRDSLIHEAVTGKLDVTRVSETQMEERLHAAGQERLAGVTV